MKSINEIDFSEKKVFIRVDFNVPFDDSGHISDNSRIVAVIPTINYILSRGGSCILASHMGRPKGKTKELSLLRLIPELEKLLRLKVLFSEDCIGEKTKRLCSNLKTGEVILLENLRFYQQETNANESFAKELSSLAEIYVNDAYGTTHREHASTVIMAKFFDLKCPGILLEKEILNLKKLMDNPIRPVTAIIGGAKVSSKISVIANMLDVVDNLIIGGGMAYTFIKNNGGSIGDSIFEKDKLNNCSEIISLAEEKNVNVFLPEDVIASNELSNKGLKKAINIYDIPKGWQGLDIGPITISKFENIVAKSKTVLWNGPMGVFEIPAFEKGTYAIAKSVAKATSNGAFSLVGGGDSVAAIKKFNLQDKVSFISTGGGAMLESLEGKILPGIKALTQK
ncbi:MAG: phosphoglycerate kinase [Flavobacteriaceae bacterium]|nr:phosphoglycerate kinase [Flavobacteriaceae bacterium]|tara:strand:- start:1978 stop:3165 length:1188 start_codon:yes stop_codon:yes gene_type:complete